MPRPSMIPTVQGKLIYLLQWAEREGYVYVAAELRDALRMLGDKEIPPHSCGTPAGDVRISGVRVPRHWQGSAQ